MVPVELIEDLLPADLVIPDWPTEALTPEIMEPAFSLDEVVLPPVEELPTPLKPPAEITEVGALPQVITADMLRARMAQRKGNDRKSEDIEIPAELLVGIEEEEKVVVVEEWEEEIESAPGKGKGKVKKKATPIIAKPVAKAKKKKRRPVGDEDDDYTGYF